MAVADRDRVAEFSALIDTFNGREKFIRFLQYSSKFQLWRAQETKNEREAKIYNQVMLSLAMTRRVLRFFRFIVVARSALNTWRAAKAVDAALLAELSSKLCLASYFFFDHFVYAIKMGAWEPPKAVEAQVALLTEGSWLGQIVSDGLLAVIKLSALASQPSQAVSEARNAQLRALTRSVLDFPVALHVMGHKSTAVLPHGVYGLFGVVTSLISLWELWPVIPVKKS